MRQPKNLGIPFAAMLLFAGIAICGAAARAANAAHNAGKAALQSAVQSAEKSQTQATPEQPLSQQESNPPLAESTTAGDLHTLPAGSVIEVRITDQINSSKDHTGQLITGTVDPSVFIENHVVIPRGTEAHMRLMEDKKGHPLGGKAKIRLELVSLVLNKEKLDIDSGDYAKHQGAFGAKLKGAGRAGSGSGTEAAATSGTPEAAAASPIIAIFEAAKVDVQPGTRIKFVLHSPFTFEEPANAGTGS